jgi:hypothetical protein
MLKFGDKVVGRVQIGNIEKALTEYDIETIIVDGFEGGIGYWAGLRKSDNKETFELKPSDEPTSTWSTKVLIEGGSIYLHDCEEETDELWELTLPKLLEGYKLNCINRPHDNDLENGDATTMDCIIQYALFGDIVYG